MNRLNKLRPRVVLLKDFYVFDTETGIQNKDGSIQWHLNGRPESFRFGVIYGYNYTKIIYSIDEFKETFREPRFQKKIVFAHNAEYDLNVLYGNIYDMDATAIFNGKFISATNGNCRFADSTNIFGKIKLADVAKMLGMVKPDLGDENLFSKNGIGPEEINRCVQDCVIVYEALISIFQSAGDIKITQAALSMTYYRRFHQPHNIDYNENTTYFFDSYFGGRTEAFKIGKTNASVIDVNSMYPFAMRVCKFPNPRNLKVEINPKQKYFLTQILPHYEGLIYADITHHKRPYGYLPYKSEGKLLFPVGQFSGCWNFNEFRYALEQGAIEIRNIKKIVYAEPMQSPFVSFVDTLYTERFKTTNDFEVYRIKIFMNSLYGKFAQRIDEESIYINNIEDSFDYIQDCQRNGTFKKLQLFNRDRMDAFLVLHSSKQYNISYSIPSFASYITSFCRVLLLQKMVELHEKKVVYCDTDSIFFEINDDIENELHLGGWKVEDKIVVEINGLKNYKYIDLKKDKTKVINRTKGIPTKAELIAEKTYQYFNLLKTKESLRRGLEPGVLVKRTKVVSGKYDKRNVNNDGSTTPIIL